MKYPKIYLLLLLITLKGFSQYSPEYTNLISQGWQLCLRKDFTNAATLYEKAFKIFNDEKKLAIKAAKILNLPEAGVDLIRSNKGPLLLEVNSSPGLEGIGTATGKDIASTMIQTIEKKLKFSR
jgi:hypothetical protein